MTKLTRYLLITLVVSAFSQPLFAADKPSSSATDNKAKAATTTTTDASSSTKPAKAISMSNLLLQLQKAGFIVKSVEFDKDNNSYKVEALDRHGEKQSLEVAGTGLTAEQKKVPHEINMFQAVKKVEKNGSQVTSASNEPDSGYKATVVDNKGNSQDYTIDYQGKVTSS